MRTYKIVGHTNPWIAQRDSKFNGRTDVVFEENLTLKQARKVLLDFLRHDFEKYFPNWGSVMHSNIGKNYCCHYPDGTYSYSYDSRTYGIEKEIDEQ